jgi:RimJ/RimL family protein N-acetyltransferase
MDDAKAIFEGYAQDNQVTRHLVWKPHVDIEETKRFLLGCVAAWQRDSRFPWAIILKESGELIGMIEIRVDGFKADVGYGLARSHWARGIATEALRPVVAWALAQPSIYRVWALCDVDNVASARVLEKVGMQREGLLRRNIVHPNISDEPRDCYCYALVK